MKGGPEGDRECSFCECSQTRLRSGSKAGRPFAAAPIFNFVGLDLDLMAHVIDVPLQEIRDLLDRRAERETVPKLGNVNREPGPCMLSVHHGRRLLLTPYVP
jgi:hypothetical protein